MNDTTFRIIISYVSSNEMNGINYTLTLILSICFWSILIGMFFWLSCKNYNTKFLKNFQWTTFFIVLLGGTALYWIGYYHTSSVENVFTLPFRSLISSLKMFIFESDLIEVDEIHHSNTIYMVCIIFCHVLAILTTTLFILQIFFRRFFVRIFLSFRLKTGKETKGYFFFGANDLTITLANDINKKKIKTQQEKSFLLFVDKIKTSVFDSLNFKENIKKTENAELFYKVEHTQSILLNDNFRITTNNNGEYNSLKKLNIIKNILRQESHLFFFNENDEDNMSFALAVIEELQKYTDITNKIYVYVKTDIDDSAIILDNVNKEKEDNKIKVISSNIEIRIINAPSIISHQIIQEHNPIDVIYTPKDEKHFHGFYPLIIGFNSIGKEILNQLIVHGQYGIRKEDGTLEENPFKAIAIDCNMDTLMSLYANTNPDVEKNYTIDFVNAEVNSSNYFKAIRENIDQINYVVICLGNDSLNIKTALELNTIINNQRNKNVTIYVHISSNEEYNYYNLANEGLHKNIKIFGRGKEIFTEDIIVKETYWQRAKKVNQAYNNIYGNNSAWEEIPMFEKLSNLSVAQHISAKLKILGLTETQLSNKDDSEIFNDEDLILLAYNEHLRWNAFSFVNGWKTMQLNFNIPQEKRIRKESKTKEHICLTSWDGLLNADKYMGKEHGFYQEIDYEIIRKIKEIIS